MFDRFITKGGTPMKKYLFLAILSSILFLSACTSSNESSSGNPSAGEKEPAAAQETVVSDSKEEEKKEDDSSDNELAFNPDDFIVELTPSGEIDSAGGVEFSYNIQNNSTIPVQRFDGDVKIEFEDGQTMVETITMRTTIMNGEAVGGRDKVYPEPASKIKSYNLIAYELIDNVGTEYNVDLQLGVAEISERGMQDISNNVEFNIDDFIVELTPSGEIDSAGGVGFSYNIQNNSSIPVKRISLDVLMEFENGIRVVDDITSRDTLMNGDSTGGRTKVYPELGSTN